MRFYLLPARRRFDPTYKELKSFFRLFGGRVYFGFDPTYKELKSQLSRVLQSLFSSRFDPTYKELKWIIPLHSPNIIPGFDPTYKELK